MHVKRVKVSFADMLVEFVDRERAIEQIGEIGRRGTYFVYVVYGPEGCGKTAFLRQAMVSLEEEFGYHVVYTNPLAKKAEEVFQYTPTVKDIVKEVFSLFPEPYSKVVDVAINVAGRIIEKFSKPRVAVLMDDIFQAVGLNQAEIYVKALLNLIEWPPKEYEKIVVLVTSSEGMTWERIGRHNWADIFVMWNMPRDGFEGLFEKLPGSKPLFEEVWRLVGGNPRYLERLFAAGWNAEKIVENLVETRKIAELVGSLSEAELEILGKALEDPDVMLKRYREAENLLRRLIEANMVLRIRRRDPDVWIDVPPPEKDPELGIGSFYAWQTPLHREAVRRVLKYSSR